MDPLSNRYRWFATGAVISGALLVPMIMWEGDPVAAGLSLFQVVGAVLLSCLGLGVVLVTLNNSTFGHHLAGVSFVLTLPAGVVGLVGRRRLLDWKRWKSFVSDHPHIRPDSDPVASFPITPVNRSKSLAAAAAFLVFGAVFVASRLGGMILLGTGLVSGLMTVTQPIKKRVNVFPGYILVCQGRLERELFISLPGIRQIDATRNGIRISHARGSDVLNIPSKHHADVLDTLSTWARNAGIGGDRAAA